MSALRDEAVAAFKRPDPWFEGVYRNDKASNIRYAYVPAEGERRGIVVLTAGYSSYKELHFETIANFRKMGLDVYAPDWQGHALSEGDDQASPQEHERDLHRFMSQIVRPDGSLPVFLATHSMGGHIGLRYMKDHPDVFDGAIMANPMTEFNTFGKLGRVFFKAGIKIADALGLDNWRPPNIPELISRVKTVGNWLGGKTPEDLASRSEAIQTIRLTNGIKEVQLPTVKWFANAFPSIKETLRDNFLKAIKTPVLIGSGGKDFLVDKESHQRVADTLPHGEMVVLENTGHSAWHTSGEDYQKWWKTVDRFVEDRIAAFNGAAAPETAVARRSSPAQAEDRELLPQSRPAFA